MVFFIQILTHFPLVKPTPKVQSWVIQRGQLIPIGFRGRLLKHDFIMSPQVTNRLLIGTVHIALLLRSVTGCLMIPAVLCSPQGLCAWPSSSGLLWELSWLSSSSLGPWGLSAVLDCRGVSELVVSTEATRTARPLRHPLLLNSTCDAVLHNVARLYPHMHKSVGSIAN